MSSFSPESYPQSLTQEQKIPAPGELLALELCQRVKGLENTAVLGRRPMCFPTLEQPGPCLGVSPSREGVGAGWLVPTLTALPL